MAEKKIYLWPRLVSDITTFREGDSEYLMMGVLAENVEEAKAKALKKVDALIEIADSDYHYYGIKGLNMLRDHIIHTTEINVISNVEMFLYHEGNSLGDDSFGNIKWFHNTKDK